MNTKTVRISGTGTARAKGVDLPKAAKAAVGKLFPGCSVGEVERRNEGGVVLYEIEVSHKGQAAELLISADGTLCRLETEITVRRLPKAVAAEAARVAKGARLLAAERVEQHAKVVAGKLITVAPAEISYEVEFARGGRKYEIVITTRNGKPTGSKVALDDDDDDDEDDDDDDGDDDEDDDD